MSRTFKELCNGLRANDPSITELSMHIYDRSRMSKLLEALEGNVHVSSLALHLTRLAEERPDLTSLCQYLSESEVLRSVTFTCYFSRSGLPGRLVRSLVASSLIQEVAFCGGAVPKYEVFLAFLQSKTLLLKRLSIPSIDWTPELGLAIGSLQALEHFTMVHSVGCPLDLMLERLQSYRRLRTLSIGAITDAINFPIFRLDDAVVVPLSCLLSNAPLETLELKDFRLSRDQLIPFLQSMQSCSTLVRLALTGDVEREAAHGMVAWF
jgi:hypothetical protein